MLSARQDSGGLKPQATPREGEIVATPEKQAPKPTLEELNKNKFIPQVIHLERSLFKNSAFKLWELIMY